MPRRATNKPPPESSPSDFRHFAARWRLVARAEVQELRAMSPAEKFRQMEDLWASARMFRWPNDEAETAALRSRWNRLRRALGD
jgi:uncharacterized protein YjiS (DUF1127 family)